ncbi:SNARE Tgl1 [Schizosaccharomyces japonicus yFS275]|uniref:SNARE Tgl1 n=1 Tax=Schizosaccharomyces japonicus (strain yFS275 / FY16936) TaxID=402676 RepID=B6JXN1_SCHJY|nr:SNARE Tgl1 [Schizosaccharomyces japonicus yFS275]EEB05175.2 SNARE Tgl1 [Schizosaccharomyces japonicus yFS275]
MQDPFHEVREDATRQLKQIQGLFAQFLKDRNSGYPTPSTELIYAIDELSETLKDLREAVKIASDNAEHFQLSAEELTERAKYVEGLERQLNDIQLGLAEESKLPPVGGTNAEAQDAVDRAAVAEDTAARRAEEQQYQQQLYQEQDVMLDSVYNTVGTIRGQAVLMGQELAEQSTMLDTLDEQLETVGSKLKTGLRRIKDFAIANADQVVVSQFSSSSL